jgi:hypothetical protein
MKYFHNATLTLYVKTEHQEATNTLSQLIMTILTPTEKEKEDITVIHFYQGESLQPQRRNGVFNRDVAEKFQLVTDIFQEDE